MARCYTVKKTSPALVTPCAPTPTGTLPFSAIDRLMGARRHLTLLMQVFTYGQDPANTIRRALGGALVPYYPVAGRIAVSSEGELHVACTGEGVWFAEATADFSLKDVDHLALPLKIPEEDLLPVATIRNDHPDLMLAIQVTKFTCGGFVVCVGFDHILFDGLGVMQFLGAVGDIARGLKQPIIEAIWCREAMPSPPKKVQGYAPSPPLIDHQLQLCTLDINNYDIEHIKGEYLKETGQRCTTFDVLVAMIWQCRTRAIQPDPQAKVQIWYAANVRPLLLQALPYQGGYYGNCILGMMAAVEAEMIMNAPFAEVLRLVLDTKARMASDAKKWVDGELEREVTSSAFVYETMTLTDWRRIGNQQVDYGWGQSYLTIPTRLPDNYAIVLIHDSPPPKSGIRLVARCVRQEHMTAFCDGMMALASPTNIDHQIPALARRTNRQRQPQQSVLS